jgi:colanic acid/amylovoran biosynthesis protein
MSGVKTGDPEKQRILVLGASFNMGLGVGALTIGALRTIHNCLPSAEVKLLDYAVEPEEWQVWIGDEFIRTELINLRFSKKAYLKNNVARLLLTALTWHCFPKKFKNKIYSRNQYLRHILCSEMALSISGGDSFSDIYGLRRFLYVTLPQCLVLLLGKRLILMPQTIGPFRSISARKIAGSILSRATLIFTRDHDGIEDILMKDDPSLRDKVRFCYDIGFVVDPKKPEKMDLDGLKLDKSHRTLVGLNINGLLYIGGYERNNTFDLKIDYGMLIETIINYIIEKKDALVLLVPHVYGEKNTESDLAISEEIYSKLKPKYNERLFMVKGIYDPSGIKYIIGQCDYFIGSRMHACVAAVSQSIPTVSIAYSKKFRGVMETIGMEEYVADPKKMDEQTIIALIDTAYERRAEIRKMLEGKMPEVKKKVLNLYKEILEELNQKNRTFQAP